MSMRFRSEPHAKVAKGAKEVSQDENSVALTVRARPDREPNGSSTAGSSRDDETTFERFTSLISLRINLMHTNKFKLLILIVLPAAVCATILLKQQQALSLTRKENLRLRTQIAQTSKLHELPQNGLPHLAETLARIDKLRAEREAELFRQETLLHTLQENASDRGALTAALVASGEDKLLNVLIEQRALTVHKRDTLTDSDTQAVQIANVSEQVADLNNKIRQRADEVFEGLKVRAETERSNPENLQRMREQALETSPKQTL